MEEIENILGRKLKPQEHVMFIMFGGTDSEYKPTKGEDGNLMYVV